MKLLIFLQKKLSVSRREFTDMIQQQVISINHEIVHWFDAEIHIDDTLTIKLPWWKLREETIQKLPFSPPKIVLFHKPKWCVVSKDDPHNKTIFDILPDHWREDLWYIWRLDKDSTGLLLLTNDTKLVDRYENPRNEVHKVYQLEINKPLRTKDKTRLKKWIEVTADGFLPKFDPDGIPEMMSCVTVTYQQTPKWKHELIITLKEWKKRQLRRLLKALDYKIYRLHRLKVGKRHIGDLKPGKRRIEKIKRAAKPKRSKADKAASKKK